MKLQRSERKANGGESNLSEAKVKNIFEKIIESKTLTIVVVLFAFSVAGLILYLIFGRSKKKEEVKE